MNFSNVTLNP